MVDSNVPTDRPADPVCTWCSAALTPETAVCASCGAILTSDEERDLPGVTAVDAKIASGAKPPPARSRLLSWISGEYSEDILTAADSQALAPPDLAVQREILRLELEAEVANLQAEADAILSEAAMEGRVIDLPEGLRPLAVTDPETEQPDADEPASEDSPASDAPSTDEDPPSTEDDAPQTEDDAPQAEEDPPV